MIWLALLVLLVSIIINIFQHNRINELEQALEWLRAGVSK